MDQTVLLLLIVSAASCVNVALTEAPARPAWPVALAAYSVWALASVALAVLGAPPAPPPRVIRETASPAAAVRVHAPRSITESMARPWPMAAADGSPAPHTLHDTL
ncbi:hypothetical protein SETIT_1G076400v2 [Setaria italica]|uniref:Uncharacterized protein n=1 Tax=Setaria italica TaxID=4555 RepID=A0A368PHW0_SETIT|nr:uncharacterized protein LOC105914698 [Setaria italica]RCV05346.1 hypothetical protein SETIT_1G076400v2 [Setaria italica]